MLSNELTLLNLAPVEDTRRPFLYRAVNEVQLSALNRSRLSPFHRQPRGVEKVRPRYSPFRSPETIGKLSKIDMQWRNDWFDLGKRIQGHPGLWPAFDHLFVFFPSIPAPTMRINCTENGDYYSHLFLEDRSFSITIVLSRWKLYVAL